MLGLSTDAVEAMVGAGFLLPGGLGPKGPEFSRSDLKAFLARNADNGAGNLFEFGADGSLNASAAVSDSIDPQALLDALDGKSDEMARRAFDIFATVFPEATGGACPSKPSSSSRPEGVSRPSWPSPGKGPKSTRHW